MNEKTTTFCSFILSEPDISRMQGRRWRCGGGRREPSLAHTFAFCAQSTTSSRNDGIAFRTKLLWLPIRNWPVRKLVCLLLKERRSKNAELDLHSVFKNAVRINSQVVENGMWTSLIFLKSTPILFPTAGVAKQFFIYVSRSPIRLLFMNCVSSSEFHRT